MEILLIEDNLNDVLMFKKALKAAGSTSNLTVAEEGGQAMAYLEKSETDMKSPAPNLIVLDLNLPGIDGLQLLKYLKTDSRLKKIPVVVFTDSESPGDVTSAYNLYANCFIIKPRDSDVFIEYIKYIDAFWTTTVTISKT